MIPSKIKIKVFIRNLQLSDLISSVKASFILNLYPETTRSAIKLYAQKGMIDNAELYLGPLPLCVALKLESRGITTIEKINEAIRAGNLDLSKFDNIGPKRWRTIMKWARIDFSSEKVFVIRLTLPLRIVSALTDMAGAADYKLTNSAIVYMVDGALAACKNLQTVPNSFLPSDSSVFDV